jgi:hypothetical protein
VLVQVTVTVPIPVFEVQVGGVLLNEAMPGSTVGELTGDGVGVAFVGVGFGVGFGVGLTGAAVVFVAGLAGDGVAVTVTVAVAVTMVADGGAAVLAGVAMTADAATTEGLAGALVTGGAEEAVAGPADGLVDAAAARCECDEHPEITTPIDAPAMIARRHFMVVPYRFVSAYWFDAALSRVKR